jgi:hypothetical protein
VTAPPSVAVEWLTPLLCFLEDSNKSLMMETVKISETLQINSILMWLHVREDFACARPESFKFDKLQCGCPTLNFIQIRSESSAMKYADA